MDENVVTLCVYAGFGRKRECVGLVTARVGMMTDRGPIARITDGGCVYIGDHRFLKPSKFLNVWHTEARRLGYPNSPGSQSVISSRTP